MHVGKPTQVGGVWAERGWIVLTRPPSSQVPIVPARLALTWEVIRATGKWSWESRQGRTTQTGTDADIWEWTRTQTCP